MLSCTPFLNNSAIVADDGRNAVAWGSLSPGVIAVNSLWINPARKLILESDVVFSKAYNWKNCVSSVSCGGYNDMDLQNIATHEFGHNGLNDLYNPPSIALTIYGYSGYGEKDKRTLGTGDISGIPALYGEV